MTRLLNDDGFTLVELTISILIMSVVVVVIGGALIFGLKTFGSTSQRLSESHDLQLAASYFAPDVASAKTVSLTADPSCPVSGSVVVTLQWTDPTAGNEVVSYVAQTITGGKQLVRHLCASATTADVIVVHALGSVGSPVCPTSCSGTPASASVSITEADGYPYTLSASRRGS
jgi:prepilin-type N-terminal cleavage/methylation domain-containing protein